MPAALPKRPRTVITLALALIVTTLGVAGCGQSHPPQINGGTTSREPTTPADPANQLAGLAAAARDNKFVAGYTYKSKGQADRTIVVSIALDGTWSVNVPGGALSGGADISVVSNPSGVYQCVLGGAATTLAVKTLTPSSSTPTSPSPSTSASPPPPAYTAPACVKVAAAGKDVPTKYDPDVEHVFSDWLTIFTSRNAPISVFTAKPVTAATSSCFSVEPSAASLAPVVDAGIFCYDANGTLTSATLANSSLTLLGKPAPAAPTNTLPGPITQGPAAPTTMPATP